MNKIYLVSNEDRTWTAVASAGRPEGMCAELTAEKNYPAQIIYTRRDLNGSAVMESDTCPDREALLESLNWIGQCCYHVSQLWDFDDDLPMKEDLALVFERADSLRNEKEQIAAADFYESVELEESEKLKQYIFWSFPVGNGLLALVERKGPGSYDFHLWENENGKRGNFYNGGILSKEDHVNSLSDAVAWVFKTYPNFALQEAYSKAKPPLAQQIQAASARASFNKQENNEMKKDCSDGR